MHVHGRRGTADPVRPWRSPGPFQPDLECRFAARSANPRCRRKLSPLVAMVKTAVLLERNETGVVMAVFELFRGVAVKVWVAVPASRETGLAGDEADIGRGREVRGCGRAGAAAAGQPGDQTDSNKDECPAGLLRTTYPCTLPAQCLPTGRASTFWKAPSVEARIFFSKLSRVCGRLSPQAKS